jgi:hypothetical protein
MFEYLDGRHRRGRTRLVSPEANEMSDPSERPHRRMALVGIASLALVVGMGLALGLAPGIGSPGQSAAATLPTVAAGTDPLVTVPTGGTWLYRTMDFSIVSIVSPTTTFQDRSLFSPSTTIQPTPARSVTLTGVLHSWVDETEAVQSATFQSPQFGSPLRQAAWQAACLLTSPGPGPHAIMKLAVPGPHTHYTGNEAPRPYPRGGTYFSDGLYPVKVSALPKTPARLAKALTTGKTGVPGLDTGRHRPSAAAPFERAVLLLLSPTVGATSRFPVEVDRAIARLPHVVSLGTVWTHTGQTGQGFAASKDSDAVTVVVNRQGSLLEVRNLQFTTWRQTLTTMVATSFCATPFKAKSWGDPPLANQVYFTTSWIDPVGTPVPVSSTAVPAYRAEEYSG